jgi:hypothetical protein
MMMLKVSLVLGCLSTLALSSSKRKAVWQEKRDGVWQDYIPRLQDDLNRHDFNRDNKCIIEPVLGQDYRYFVVAHDFNRSGLYSTQELGCDDLRRREVRWHSAGGASSEEQKSYVPNQGKRKPSAPRTLDPVLENPDALTVEPKLYKGKIRFGIRWCQNDGINGLQIQDIFLPQPDLQVGDIIIGINGDSLLNKTNKQRIQLVIHHLKNDGVKLTVKRGAPMPKGCRRPRALRQRDTSGYYSRMNAKSKVVWQYRPKGNDEWQDFVPRNQYNLNDHDFTGDRKINIQADQGHTYLVIAQGWPKEGTYRTDEYIDGGGVRDGVREVRRVAKSMRHTSKLGGASSKPKPKKVYVYKTE